MIKCVKLSGSTTSLFVAKCIVKLTKILYLTNKYWILQKSAALHMLKFHVGLVIRV